MIDSASNATKPVWIDPSWLSWEYRALQSVPEESTSFDPSDTITSPSEATARLYDIHQHACDRLEGEPSRDDRGDTIIALRRVVGRRVKELTEIYELRKLPTGVKPKYDLELLEYFGIIRPFMLKRLIDLRNSVEHEDSSPPPTDECLMFVDLVWYFLRSTDKLVHGRVEEIDFEGHISDTDIETRDFFSVRARFWQSYVERPHIYAFLDSS
jgi:hypothetical protein